MKLDDARAAFALQVKPRRPVREVVHEWLPGVIIILVALGFASLIFRDWIAYQFTSSEQAAEWRATDVMLSHIQYFSVACPDSNTSPADMQRWGAYAKDKGWTPYPAGGAGCVDP